jgi:hypothetical protein
MPLEISVILPVSVVRFAISWSVVIVVSTGPWNHVIAAIGCGYFACNYSKWEVEMLAKLNAKRKEKGFSEITRSDLSVFNKK